MSTFNAFSYKSSRDGDGLAPTGIQEQQQHVLQVDDERAITGNSLSWWQQYQKWVQRNRDTLWLLDASVSRLLLLVRNHSRDDVSSHSSSWRPVAWGLLELHRLLLDLAEQQDSQEELHRFGTSLEVTTPPPPKYAAHIRWALTIVHTLAPVALELVPQQRQQQQAKVRRMVERIRFVLRLTLLLTYWKRLQQQQQQQQSSSLLLPVAGAAGGVVSVPPGLLLQGGRAFYQSHADGGATITTLEQEQYRIQRNQYVGRRTGRRLIPKHYDNDNLTTNNSATNTTTSTDTIRLRTYLGELLYIVRPLLQAEAEVVASCSVSPAASSQRLLKQSWLVGLLLDVFSLQCLRATTTTTNTATVQEWQRRRLRLLLYLLRAPVGPRVTEPLVQRVASVAQQRIPLVGGWLHNYLWDFLYYWKDYRLEEG